MSQGGSVMGSANTMLRRKTTYTLIQEYKKKTQSSIVNSGHDKNGD